MRKILACLLILCSLATKAQLYNNEWIDHAKTYYKFKVSKTGLYRIPHATLAAAGITGAAEHFQLWRNGVEVPIYTSKAAGALSSGDYIEFWGRQNDGVADKSLYRRPEFQLNDKWSLETDTSMYFLTVNPTGNNRRLTEVANNVAGNALPREAFFNHTIGNYYRDKINPGYAVNVGEYLYSSSYDKGEGYTSGDLGMGTWLTTTFTNLFIYPQGPAPIFRINVSGNAINTRQYRAEINDQTILDNKVDYFNYSRDSAYFPLAHLSTNSATVKVSNRGTTPSDRMVIHQYEFSYPREFNFGGASNFEFQLPARAAGAYLEISGFAFGSAAPVLYDLTAGKRYVGEVSGALVKIVVEPTSAAHNYVLVSEDVSNLTTISALRSRTFTNYSLPANAGNYLIISNPALFAGANGINPVEEYRLYRSSAPGGSLAARVYLTEDLADQFSFGIPGHPESIRNFLMYARAKFPSLPKNVLLIGKAVNYTHARASATNPDMAKLNLVPTFGWPASDVLLTAQPGDGNPLTPIGRLSVVNGEEIMDYLRKVKEYEQAQKSTSPYIQDKAWMKNVVHIVGASEPGLQLILDNYMTDYKKIIADTLFGGKVTTFTKSSPEAIEQLNSGGMDRLFEEGISLITYFGHSSATTLDFNLNNPDQYNNQGKYPMFVGLGCNAGNFYNFNSLRLSTKETLSEKFVLAPNRGTIGFIASSHFGIVHYLDISNSRQYKSIAYEDYGKSMGEIMLKTIRSTFAFTTQDDFYARAQSEETSLHGDPAIILNGHKRPDYVIEPQLLKIAPAFVSVADNSFRLQASFINLGRAIDRPIVIEVKQEYPNGTSRIIYRDTVPGIRYIDSIGINVPIVASRDKGSNKLTVTVDADNVTEELFETNNSITKEVFIYEEEARPIFPYTYAIVNQQNIKLKASTANPFSEVKQYRMELDTSETFSAPLRVQTVSAPGGVIEFDPGITFSDSTVYYWRIAAIPTTGAYTWNSSSFVYHAALAEGSNQSHYFQHTKSSFIKTFLDSTDREWKAESILNNLFIRNGVWSTAVTQESDLVVSVNANSYMRNTCHYGIIFNVFDKNSFKPWRNQNVAGQGLYGSLKPDCAPSRIFNFEFSNDTSGRRKAKEFLGLIPSGNYVVLRNQPFPNAASNQFVSSWINDEAIYGVGNSLYSRLKGNGVTVIDSFYKLRAYAAVFKMNDLNYTVKQINSLDERDKISLSADCLSGDSVSVIRSPQFGPAKAWKELHWKGFSVETTPTDRPVLSIVGIRHDGTVDTLVTNITSAQERYDISFVNAAQYPYMQLSVRNTDTVNFTPYQLKYWRLTYDPVPEGAVVPATFFSAPDTVDIGEPANFKLAFKNISSVAFDSVRVKIILLDKDNLQHVLLNERRRPLPVNDTLRLEYKYDNLKYPGTNNVFMEFNADGDQPEQYHFNNFVFRNLFVKSDTLNPLLDVTFDNAHILNGDLVSAKPNIIIKLKDEAKWMLLDTASLVSVQIKYPDGTTRSFNTDNDTLKFIPAQQAPNGNNTATLDFNPHFSEDGEYELIVTGKDRSNNKAGVMEYRVGFQVISKAMISNMLNYPNPFTTSTAFVFTITGAEVPQNLKIQILTVTGKIVREITKEELGALRVGRNITEYKWDGTDQYGQKLANGVYIYRVVTNLNGKSLDKYRAKGDDTDKYFNKGYGKMYLMR